MWSQQILDVAHLENRLCDSLAGRDQIVDIVHAESGISAWPSYTVPIPFFAKSSAGFCGYAARARLTHAGRRLMAWIIVQSHNGHPLPSTLDEVVPIFADGRALIGGSSLNYGLVYTRLSDTRFRLQIDPKSQTPDYAAPENLYGLIADAKKAMPQDGSIPAIVNQQTIWEADVQRLSDATAVEMDVEEESEPAAPQATN
jgi:hypothetical protein